MSSSKQCWASFQHSIGIRAWERHFLLLFSPTHIYLHINNTYYHFRIYWFYSSHIQYYQIHSKSTSLWLYSNPSCDITSLANGPFLTWYQSGPTSMTDFFVVSVKVLWLSCPTHFKVYWNSLLFHIDKIVI